MLDRLDSATEDELRQGIWLWSAGIVALVLAVTVVLMWVRQGRYGHWTFDSQEFEAIGTWFSGMAASAALFSGAALVVNDRRRQRVRDRLADANEVQYHYRDKPNPSWVVHNGSSRSIRVLAADGRDRRQTVLPGGEMRLRDATMLAAAGYRGDQPVADLVFEDGEYLWTRARAALGGERMR
jgi:hypothetical protein